MTRTRQDKTAKPDAVELNDAALDRAAGGGEVKYYTIELGSAGLKPGDGSVRTIKDTI